VRASAARVLASALLAALAACSAPPRARRARLTASRRAVAGAGSGASAHGAAAGRRDRAAHLRLLLGTGQSANGLVPDRWPTPSFSSIAAVGFGLSAYGVGVERGWITREQALRRTLATLRFFDSAPQGEPRPA
jgi:hypothetical protein